MGGLDTGKERGWSYGGLDTEKERGWPCSISIPLFQSLMSDS